jgi:hypothetical protein
MLDVCPERTRLATAWVLPDTPPVRVAHNRDAPPVLKNEIRLFSYYKKLAENQQKWPWPK